MLKNQVRLDSNTTNVSSQNQVPRPRDPSFAPSVPRSYCALVMNVVVVGGGEGGMLTM